jgi:hypothetical protein
VKELAPLRKAPYIFPIALIFLLATGFTAVSLVKAGVAVNLYSDWIQLIRSRVTGNAIAGFWGAYIGGLFETVRDADAISEPKLDAERTALRAAEIDGGAGGRRPGWLLHQRVHAHGGVCRWRLPVIRLWRWAVSTGSQVLKVSTTDTPIRAAWTTVQGLSQDIIDRLEEADITSPCHLARAEPVNLHLKTNIEWRTVLDMIDQAFLVVYVEDNIHKLRSLGIRGSIEAAILWQRLSDPSADVKRAAEDTVNELVTALGQGRGAVLTLLQNLYEDSQVNLIWELWFKD